MEMIVTVKIVVRGETESEIWDSLNEALLPADFVDYEFTEHIRVVESE